jgi:hypothetical protein
MEETNYHRDISTGLGLPKLHTYNNMKNSFTCMYDGANIWISIPKEIRETKSLSSFAAHNYE